MRALLALACVVGLAGCDADDAGTNDLAVPADLTAIPDLMPAGPCDPLAQTGCAPGLKCAFARVGSGANATAGTKCEPDGTVPVGAACTRTTGSIDSDCQGGAFCASLGTATLTCRKLCAKTSDCGAGAGCARFLDTVGYCVPACTPGGSDCASGLDCSVPVAGLGSTLAMVKDPFWACRILSTDGGAPPYTGCKSSTECAAGEFCEPRNSWCAPLCDLSNDNCPQPPQDGGVTNPAVSCKAYFPGFTPGICF